LPAAQFFIRSSGKKKKKGEKVPALFLITSNVQRGGKGTSYFLFLNREKEKGEKQGQDDPEQREKTLHLIPPKKKEKKRGHSLSTKKKREKEEEIYILSIPAFR